MQVIKRIRASLERKIDWPLPREDEMQSTEWCREFEQAMRARLRMATFRYGRFKDRPNRAHNMMQNITKRVERYRLTGNLECLADIANLAMLEFSDPRHPAAHFKSEDDGEHC